MRGNEAYEGRETRPKRRAAYLIGAAGLVAEWSTLVNMVTMLWFPQNIKKLLSI
jgi:hypothetical protein